MTRERGRVSWVMLVTLAVLGAGLAVGIAQWRASTSTPEMAELPAPALDDTSESIIDQALAQVPVDSTELRNRWLDEVRFADVATLNEKQLDLFVRVANTRRCSCGCGFTLATCRAYDTTCPVSGPHVGKLIDSVRAGTIPDRGWRKRPEPGKHG